MENKDKKKIIILIAALLIIIEFNIYRNLPTNQIKRYISNRGFELEHDKTFYYKKISCWMDIYSWFLNFIYNL